MKITRKLALLVAVPLVGVLGFAAVAISTSAGDAIRAERLRQLATASDAAGELARQLQVERAEAVLTLIGVESASPDELGEITARTDAAVDRYHLRQESLPSMPEASATLLRVDSELDQLGTLRQQTATGNGAASAVGFIYRAMIADLITFRQQVPRVGRAPAEVGDQMRAAAALSQAREYLGRQQVAVLYSIGYGSLTPIALQEITTARTGHLSSRLTFDALSVPQWRPLWEQAVIGQEANISRKLLDEVTRQEPGERPGVDPAELAAAVGGHMSQLGNVEGRVDDDVTAAVTRLRDTQRRLAAAQVAGVLAAVALAVGLAIWLGRPMVRGLARLRDAAHQVAYEHLPGAVATLDDPQKLGGLTPEQFADRAPAPVRVTGRDELAEVGAAFNTVHREALRTAAGQALLRVSIAAMFVNLARRGQGLAGRLTAALDEAERDEHDPRRLQQLFTVDHLVTLLGRTNESLLVLGGAAPAHVRDADESLAAIITAAQGQVEEYTRIEAGMVDGGVAVAAGAVDDVVKLLAELCDNACRYSPPGSPVWVNARWLSDRVVVQVADDGIGLEPAKRDALNQRLARRPALDLTAVRAMGLTVVGHIAARHGIRVELRPGPVGGTIGEVTLPPGVFTPDPEPARGSRASGTTGHAAPSAAAPDPASGPIAGVPAAGARAGGVPAAGARAGGAPPEPAVAPQPAKPGPPAAAERTAELPLPIYEQVRRSVWFDPHPTPDHRTGTTDGWATLADDGWRAAAGAAAPAPDGTTPQGLPRRRPGAQYVPGGVDTGDPPITATTVGQWRDPAAVSASLAAYSRGINSGRASASQSPPADRAS